MEIIILAAGEGKRLGHLTRTIPKCLLPVGAVTILDRQIDACIANGLTNITIVIGHKHEKVRNHCLRYDRNIQFIQNDVYDTTNNIFSLWLAREKVKDGFIILNSDDVFHPQILSKLLYSTDENVLMIDFLKRLGEEEMKVTYSDGTLRSINKTMPPEDAHGEYIGMAKFSSAGAKALFQSIQTFVDASRLNGWYENAFQKMCSNTPIHATGTDGLPWIEIDTVDDLELAKNVVRAIDEE